MATSTVDSTTPPRSVTWWISTVLAVIAPVSFVVALAYGLVPVANPGVQQCGPPVVTMLWATPDAPLYTDDGDPIHGWTDAQIHRAYERRCSVRAAERMVPAGIAFGAFLVLGTTAFVLSWADRRSSRRRAAVTNAAGVTAESE